MLLPFIVPSPLCFCFHPFHRPSVCPLLPLSLQSHLSSVCTSCVWHETLPVSHSLALSLSRSLALSPLSLSLFLSPLSLTCSLFLSLARLLSLSSLSLSISLSLARLLSLFFFLSISLSLSLSLSLALLRSLSLWVCSFLHRHKCATGKTKAYMFHAAIL